MRRSKIQRTFRNALLAVPAALLVLAVAAQGQAQPADNVLVIPNLLDNGGFEEGFSDGVAEGWIGHAGEGGGQFSENPKTGPIGGGLYGAARCWTKPCEEDVQTMAMSGKVHLVDIGRMDMTSKIRDAMGADAIVVLQLYVSLFEPQLGHGTLDGDPEANGRAFADFCYQKSQQTGHWPRCYHGLVEPNLDDPEALAKACRFELGFTNRLHEHGCRSCVLNHGPGSPADLENMFTDEVRELLAVADYVGYHAYGGHDGELMCDAATRDEFSLRWRQIAEGYREREWRFPPVIYTEGTVREGWIAEGEKYTPEMIREDLTTFGDFMEHDPWAVGLCVYLTGAWPMQAGQDRDITKYPERIIQPLAAWNRAHPVDAHRGAGSQVIGAYGEPVDRSICQAVATQPGETYEFTGWFKFEFFDCQGQPLGHKAAARVGFDPTGQTDNPDADSIEWSDNLIGSTIPETDIFYRHRSEFTTSTANTSVWIRFTHPEPKPSTRLCIDDVSFWGRQEDNGGDK